MYDYKQKKVIAEIITSEKLRFGIPLSNGVYFLAAGMNTLYILHIPTQTVDTISMQTTIHQIVETVLYILVITNNQIFSFFIDDYSLSIMLQLTYVGETMLLELKNEKILISNICTLRLVDEYLESRKDIISTYSKGFYIDNHVCMAEIRPGFVLASRGDLTIDRIDCNNCTVMSSEPIVQRQMESITVLENGTFVTRYDNDDICVCDSNEREIRKVKEKVQDRKVFEIEPNVICFLSNRELMVLDTAEKEVSATALDADSILYVKKV
jgi:hypothetical protein